MTALLRRYGLPILIAGVAAAALWRAACVERRLASTPAQAEKVVEAQRELAAEHIEQAETKSKEVRRAARARTDLEVSHAADADDLVGYLNSRHAGR